LATRPVNEATLEAEVVGSPSAVSKDLKRQPSEEKFAVPAAPTELPVSKIANAQWEESRRLFWDELRAYAAEADLTESEWQRFLGDISDVAASEITAHETAAEEHASGAVADAFRLTNELALELDERCASWMTEKQLKVYRFRLSAVVLISQSRRLKTLGSISSVLSDAR
jgi:hypothetical protein